MRESKLVKFFMPILKQRVNSSSKFLSFSSVITHNSSVNFTERSHGGTNYDTFKYSGENLPNSSCHFPNHKSVFLQILHDSSVSWTITPLYFFGSNVIYSVSSDVTPMYFLAKILYTFNRSSLSKHKFGEISSEQSKVWNFSLWWASFVKII